MDNEVPIVNDMGGSPHTPAEESAEFGSATPSPEQDASRGGGRDRTVQGRINELTQAKREAWAAVEAERARNQTLAGEVGELRGRLDAMSPNGRQNGDAKRGFGDFTEEELFKGFVDNGTVDPEDPTSRTNPQAQMLAVDELVNRRVKTQVAEAIQSARGEMDQSTRVGQVEAQLQQKFGQHIAQRTPLYDAAMGHAQEILGTYSEKMIQQVPHLKELAFTRAQVQLLAQDNQRLKTVERQLEEMKRQQTEPGSRGVAPIAPAALELAREGKVEQAIDELNITKFMQQRAAGQG